MCFATNKRLSTLMGAEPISLPVDARALGDAGGYGNYGDPQF